MPDSTTAKLYSPQYVVGGGYKSTVTLINLEDPATTVTITRGSNTGDRPTQVGRFSVPGRGRLVISDADLQEPAASSGLRDGFLIITSDTTLITGTVRFGDSDESRFQTTLPLVSQTYTEITYPQVAQNETYFTGVAIVNRSMSGLAANVTISIFNSSGVQVGSGQRTIPRDGRISELLSQIDPKLPAISSGYFKVTSDQTISSFALFGTNSLSVLAAIPPQ